ncbi:MAG TPA: ABC transporter permease [Bryobacteraceae bacterium]|jgi:predicted permease|nr:ABC transporter permease [Bryobacteraceae bacterium]
MKLLARQFRETPLTLLSCIAVLAIGIGGATAAFSALYTVVLRPLPYPNPQQLVAVHSRFPRLQMDRLGVSPLDYLDLRQHKDLFGDAGAFFYRDLSRTGQPHAEKVNALAISSSLLTTFEVRPQIGRSFQSVEEQPGGPHVVLISNAYWQSAFGRDPNILHRSLELNGERYSIIGVMPRSFAFPNDITQMWVPVVFKPSWLGHLGRQNVFLRMYARLENGITFKQATQRLDVISRRAAIANRADYTVDLTDWKYFLTPLKQDDNPSRQVWAWVLFWSVAVLLVIACVNVGGLLVLRSAERAFEMSVRLALGAGNGRIAGQALLEMALLCACGGIAGAGVAVASMRLLNQAGQFGRLQLSVPVLLFGIVVTIAAATLCSLYPLWRVAQANPLDAMKSAGHQRTASHHRQHTRRTLIVVQVAASTALLIVGGLLLHTYARLLETPLGFQPNHVMTMTISLPPLRYASASSRGTFYQSVLDRIRHVPGISDASACNVLPFGYGENMEPFALPDQPAGSAQQLASVDYVMPRFFETLRIPLLAGRYFNSADTPGHSGVVIINRYLADHYFGHKDAIGEQIELGDRRVSIIGVVGNIKVDGLDVSDGPMLYVSAGQMPRTDMSLVIKSDSASRVPELVQSIVSQIDHDQPVYDVASLQSRIDASLATRRFVAFLLASFSGLGIVITAVGLYGLLSYSVLLRRQEFGIRAAVGATPRSLGLLMVTQGMRLIVVGTLTGSAIAFAAARYLSSQISDVRIEDLATWLSVAVILISVGLISSTLPAWRASRSSPASLMNEN